MNLQVHLHHAIISRNASITRAALASIGLQLNKYRSPNGRTFVATAVLYSSGEILDLLVASGANADEPDGMGITPLMLAAEGNRVDIIEILLKNRVNQDAKDGRGRDAFDWARRYGGVAAELMLRPN